MESATNHGVAIHENIGAEYNPALVQSLINEVESSNAPQTPILDSRLGWTHRMDMQSVWAKVVWAKIKTLQ